MNTRDAEGGISLDAQEAEARARAEDQELDAQMKSIHREVKCCVQEFVEIIGPTQQRRIERALWWALRRGVQAAESGALAERILQTEKKA